MTLHAELDYGNALGGDLMDSPIPDYIACRADAARREIRLMARAARLESRRISAALPRADADQASREVRAFDRAIDLQRYREARSLTSQALREHVDEHAYNPWWWRAWQAITRGVSRW